MSSNFFSQQDLARRNTRILVLLFSIAVALLILLTNVLVLASFGLVNPAQPLSGDIWQQLPWPTVLAISATVVVAVGGAILYKWQQLQQGGKVVAIALGGQLVAPDSTDTTERRLLNVVEEMALAANTPVPPVYLLPEKSINAFAAGYSPADAVIGVTQGCASLLSRDELQGVIAHEFSHILNGDMRMNIRLIAILNGILFLGHIGYYLLRGSHSSTVRRRSSNDKNGGGIVVLALGLVVIGYLGSFFGNLIKAAVSRQREFLADASAVQFTRNPRGIAGALKVIGSHSSLSKIASPNANENSHLFFGEAISRWASVFATHPPLATRIKRLEPHWNGKFPTARTAQNLTGDSTQQKTAAEHSGKAATTGSTDSAAVSATSANISVQQHQMLLPLLLLHSSRQTEPAVALVCCLLLSEQHQIRTQQLSQIKQQGSTQLLSLVDQLCDEVAALDAVGRVQLMQCLLPALKTLPYSQYQKHCKLWQALQNCWPDRQLSIWLVYEFIHHSLAVHNGERRVSERAQAINNSNIKAPARQLLVLVASVAGDKSAQQQAWQAALKVLHSVGGVSMPDAAALPDIDFTELSTQLPFLLALAPKQKQLLWQAVMACAQADNLLQTEEKALLLALALLLQVPFTAS